MFDLGKLLYNALHGGKIGQFVLPKYIHTKDLAHDRFEFTEPICDSRHPSTHSGFDRKIFIANQELSVGNVRQRCRNNLEVIWLWKPRFQADLAVGLRTHKPLKNVGQ